MVLKRFIILNRESYISTQILQEIEREVEAKDGPLMVK